MSLTHPAGWNSLRTVPMQGFLHQRSRMSKILIIPTICLYEVFKITLARAGEDEALHVAGLMSFGKIMDLDREIALTAGQISNTHKLPMADSIIYATAQANAATLWTQDEHFKGLPDVKFIHKK